MKQEKRQHYERALTTTILNSWSQYGQTIISGGTNDIRFGIAISMNSDGTIIAVGADLGFSTRGSVLVYRYDARTWIQLGTTMKGSSGSEFGKRVSMNGAGDVLAVGAPSDGQNGCCRVYSYDGADWVQVGNDMCGLQANERFAFRVGLSGESTTINAIVAFGSTFWNNKRGQVSAYSYDAGTDS